MFSLLEVWMAWTSPARSRSVRVSGSGTGTNSMASNQTSPPHQSSLRTNRVTESSVRLSNLNGPVPTGCWSSVGSSSAATSHALDGTMANWLTGQACAHDSVRVAWKVYLSIATKAPSAG